MIMLVNKCAEEITDISCCWPHSAVAECFETSVALTDVSSVMLSLPWKIYTDISETEANGKGEMYHTA